MANNDNQRGRVKGGVLTLSVSAVCLLAVFFGVAWVWTELLIDPGVRTMEKVIALSLLFFVMAAPALVLLHPFVTLSRERSALYAFLHLQVFGVVQLLLMTIPFFCGRFDLYGLLAPGIFDLPMFFFYTVYLVIAMTIGPVIYMVGFFCFRELLQRF